MALKFCDVIGVLLVTAGVAFAGGAENLVENAGFEQGAASWKIPGPVWKIGPDGGFRGSSGLVGVREDASSGGCVRQTVPLVAGASYRFTALVKLDASVRGMKPHKQPLTVGLEWHDAEGRWLAGAYAVPVEDNAPSLSGGWVRFAGKTPPMPGNVGTGSVVCTFGKGVVGKVWLDDFTLEQKSLQPVEYFLSSAYRNEAVSGEVRFFARLHLNVAVTPVEGCCARLRYRGADGTERELPSETFDAEQAMFRLDVAQLKPGQQDLELVIRHGARTVISEKLAFSHPAELPQRRVALDAVGRVLLDGKPFFPMGMYAGQMKSKQLKHYAQSPFNFIMPYKTPKDLSAYEQAGLLVGIDVRKLLYGYHSQASSCKLKTLEESWQALREVYGRFGRSPSFFAWYMNDEAKPDCATDLRRGCDFLHAIDPDHPTFTVINNPAYCANFASSSDVMAVDPYPIGSRTGAPISTVTDWMCDARAAMRDIRPMWCVPQAFDWSWYRKDNLPSYHMPTRAEMAQMTWQSVAAGANGILYYCYHGIMERLEGAARETAWTDVCAVAQEVLSVKDVLLADPAVPWANVPKGLSVRGWTKDRVDWRLLVNLGREPFRTTVALPTAIASLESRIGAGVSRTADGRALSVELPALGYALVGLLPGGRSVPGRRIMHTTGHEADQHLHQGTWFTGPIHLKSDVDLHLAEGAAVEFSDDPKDCLPEMPVRTR